MRTYYFSRTAIRIASDEYSVKLCAGFPHAELEEEVPAPAEKGWNWAGSFWLSKATGRHCQSLARRVCQEAELLRGCRRGRRRMNRFSGSGASTRGPGDGCPPSPSNWKVTLPVHKSLSPSLLVPTQRPPETAASSRPDHLGEHQPVFCLSQVARPRASGSAAPGQAARDRRIGSTLSNMFSDVRGIRRVPGKRFRERRGSAPEPGRSANRRTKEQHSRKAQRPSAPGTSRRIPAGVASTVVGSAASKADRQAWNFSSVTGPSHTSPKLYAAWVETSTGAVIDRQTHGTNSFPSSTRAMAGGIILGTGPHTRIPIAVP